MKTIKLTNEEYIELLENERKELLRDISRKDKEIERLNNIINDMDKQIDNLCNNQKREVDRLNNKIEKAKHFIDQVLGYHLSSGYEQLDKDCNELFGILKGVDK